MELQILKPFGPSILKVKIPQKLVEDINNHIDQLILDKNKISDLDYGFKLAGDVTQEFLLDPNFVKEVGWLEFLGKCTYQWIKTEMKQDIKKFNIIQSWVVRQFENEYNPTHWHGGHISGAGFLKVPKSLGNWKQEKKINKKTYSGGYLNLIHGSKMFLSESSVLIKPEVGDFYFFPNYLMHAVFPFKGTSEERRSISFNAVIDESIYNVYSS